MFVCAFCDLFRLLPCSIIMSLKVWYIMYKCPFFTIQPSRGVLQTDTWEKKWLESGKGPVVTQKYDDDRMWCFRNYKTMEHPERGVWQKVGRIVYLCGHSFCIFIIVIVFIVIFIIVIYYHYFTPWEYIVEFLIVLLELLIKMVKISIYCHGMTQNNFL